MQISDVIVAIAVIIRELKQARGQCLKLAYLTMKNSTFARFARAFVIFGHLADVFVLSKT